MPSLSVRKGFGLSDISFLFNIEVFSYPQMVENIYDQKVKVAWLKLLLNRLDLLKNMIQVTKLWVSQEDIKKVESIFRNIWNMSHKDFGNWDQKFNK